MKKYQLVCGVIVFGLVLYSLWYDAAPTIPDLQEVSIVRIVGHEESGWAGGAYTVFKLADGRLAYEFGVYGEVDDVFVVDVDNVRCLIGD